MEVTDHEEFYGSSDHHHPHTSFPIKGRRTKRQRTAAASSFGGGGGAGYIDNSSGSSVSASVSMSASATPSNTDEHDVMSEVTTEEEDMANCLILLAQGVKKSIKRRSNNNKGKNNNNNNTNTNPSTSTSGGGVIGVYECKTCNRTFPSFQALGGHRTSHKKVKPNTVAVQPVPTLTTTTTVTSLKIEHHGARARDPDRDLVVVIDDVDGVSHDSSPLPSSLDITNTNTSNSNSNANNNKVMRVHECSICGSEFSSGQALGGHMRRHRPIPPAVVDHNPQITDISTAVIDSGGPRNILSLDLNLPAPDHDHDHDVGNQDNSHMVDTKFHVLANTPALVDCHY